MFNSQLNKGNPVPELSRRKITDRRLSFGIYLGIMLILIGLLITIAAAMVIYWIHPNIPRGVESYYYFNFNYGLPFFPGYFSYFAGWTIATVAIFLALSTVFWWYQWQLYIRRNEHIERSKNLRKSLSAWLKEKYKINLEDPVSSDIQISLHEQPRSTGFFVLWVILSYLLAPVGLIFTLVIWYWLTSDYYIHEQGEIRFFYQLSEKLKERKILFNPKIVKPLPPRSMILYIVLMIIPGVNLVWAIWWSYVLFQDPNTHFDSHELWESQLEKIIGEPKPAPSSESPIEILKRRYAKGEITKEEFEQMKKDLTD